MNFGPIHAHNDKNTARFLLGKQTDNMIACLGINPSTATPEKPDRTVMSVRRIAQYQGYSGYLMLNVYPQRATRPQQIHKRINKSLHAENLKQIQVAVRRYRIGVLWLAFGDLIDYRPYLKLCLLELVQILAPAKLQYVISEELTAKGNPRHPLYQKTTTALIPFDVQAYLETSVL